MSEESGGAGWWMASDGKWYPPELHPDASTRPVSADAGQGSAVGPSTYLSQQNVPFQPVSGGQQAVTQQAGGLGASSGGLPPLGGLPPMGGAGTAAGGVGVSGPGAVSGWGSGPAPAQPYGQPQMPPQPGYAQPGYAQPGYGQAFDYQGFGVPGGGPLAEGRRPKRRRLLVIVGSAVVVVVAVAGSLFGFGVISLASTGIPLGAGTATITWPKGSTSQSSGFPAPSQFSGTVSGMSVTGTGQFSPNFFKDLLGQSGAVPAKVPFFVVQGMMQKKAFSMTVSIPRSELRMFQQLGSRSGAGAPSIVTVTYDVDGTYGTEAISGTLTQTGDPNSNVTPPMAMHLAIGSLRVSGSIDTANGTNRATATYSIS